MHQDEIEASLTSSEPAVDYDTGVSLQITAYFRDDGTSDGNTLSFPLFGNLAEHVEGRYSQPVYRLVSQ